MALAAPRICCLDLDTFFVSVERLLDPQPDGKAGRGRRASGSARGRHCGELRGAGARRALGDVAARAPSSSRRTPCSCRRATACTATTLRACGGSRRGTRRCRRSRASTRCFSTSPAARAVPAATATPVADATIERVVRAAHRRDSERASGCRRAPASRPAVRSPRWRAASPSRRASCSCRPGAEAAFLGPLPVRKFPGIGPVAEQKLRAIGLSTLAHVAAAPLGSSAAHLRCLGRVDSARLPRPGRARARARAAGVSGVRSAGSAHRHHLQRAHVPRRRARRRAASSRCCARCASACAGARASAASRRAPSRSSCGTQTSRPCTRSRTITPTCSELELYPVVLDSSRARAGAAPRDPPARNRTRLICARYDEQLLAVRRSASRCTGRSTASERATATTRFASRSPRPVARAQTRGSSARSITRSQTYCRAVLLAARRSG